MEDEHRGKKVMNIDDLICHDPSACSFSRVVTEKARGTPETACKDCPSEWSDPERGGGEGQELRVLAGTWNLFLSWEAHNILEGTSGGSWVYRAGRVLEGLKGDRVGGGTQEKGWNSMVRLREEGQVLRRHMWLLSFSKGGEMVTVVR